MTNYNDGKWYGWIGVDNRGFAFVTDAGWKAFEGI